MYGTYDVIIRSIYSSVLKISGLRNENENENISFLFITVSHYVYPTVELYVFEAHKYRYQLLRILGHWHLHTVVCTQYNGFRQI